MNIKDHLLTASVMLNFALGVWIVVEHYDEFIFSRLISLFVSLLFFFFGVQVVDWEQSGVQKKLKFIFWLEYITDHRGWWHTLVGMVIYGGFIAGIMAILWYFFGFEFWVYPISFGMLGYWSHLLGDDINTIKNNTGMPLVSIRIVKWQKIVLKKKGKKK